MALDADNVRAEVGKHHARVRPGADAGEFDDAQARERPMVGRAGHKLSFRRAEPDSSWLLQCAVGYAGPIADPPVSHRTWLVAMHATVTLHVDGQTRVVALDTRTTLLDALRDHLGIMSPKKGCDHGQCGSCTVLLDGRRATTCLALAVAHDGAHITTATGLAGDGTLHRLQQAFVDCDAYQCGYCTPGQICSAVGMLGEAAAGRPSYVTGDLTADAELTDEEIRERMSGNLCRCGAYVNIVAAIREVAAGGVQVTSGEQVSP
jgi:xanthine dehydrogenase YagT iron-sulfur-binding subunit